jgi:hypothetical protein
MSRGHGSVQRRLIEILRNLPRNAGSGLTTSDLVRRFYATERYSEPQRLVVKRSLIRLGEERVVLSRADKGGRGHDRLWRINPQHKKRRAAATLASVSATA